jgi:hypothetical protein
MAIVWLKLFAITEVRCYYQAGAASLRYVMSCQDICTPDANIRGGSQGIATHLGEIHTVVLSELGDQVFD